MHMTHRSYEGELPSARRSRPAFNSSQIKIKLPHMDIYQDLNILNNLASVTIRVRHNGHSLVPFMMRSEHGRHMHKCLDAERFQSSTISAYEVHVPAIDDGDVGLLVLAYHT